MSATAMPTANTRFRETLQKRLVEIESAQVANEQTANAQRAATIAERERLNRERNALLAELANLS